MRACNERAVRAVYDSASFFAVAPRRRCRRHCRVRHCRVRHVTGTSSQYTLLVSAPSEHVTAARRLLILFPVDVGNAPTFVALRGARHGVRRSRCMWEGVSGSGRAADKQLQLGR